MKMQKAVTYTMRSEQFRYVHISPDEYYLYDLDKDPIQKYDLAQNPDYKAVIHEFQYHLKEIFR
jgi:arylsulfatase A-like enzyme